VDASILDSPLACLGLHSLGLGRLLGLRIAVGLLDCLDFFFFRVQRDGIMGDELVGTEESRHTSVFSSLGTERMYCLWPTVRAVKLL